MIVGATGSIWIILWLLSTRGARAAEMSHAAQAQSLGSASMPFRDVFFLRSFWITMAIGLTVNMSWHFYRVWLPRHLVVDLRFDDQQIQYLLIGFYLRRTWGASRSVTSRAAWPAADARSSARGKSS